MKRQKRDRLERAHSRGYQAGLGGKPRDNCPYGTLEAKEQWLGGWREAKADVNSGLFG
ncbi:ribosome modulation factor [Pleionea litopenaei]|uniref:Ribosome modulation factor n=1 Tax=Pleionea litopenaei TaxID=3070815 RepID=A0AA51RVK6_9GAMM|nr:ribosome modulation factor [Pleionea sp. HL-JVS1]WMS88258.1 ribosome modulation factor [Pleionea sp. HL-JVS1]